MWRLLPGKGDGDGRASPATAPTPIPGFPELRPPTRQPRRVPRQTAGRRASSRLQGPPEAALGGETAGLTWGATARAPLPRRPPPCVSLWGRLAAPGGSEAPARATCGRLCKAGLCACLRRASLYYGHEGKASAGIPFLPRTGVGGEAGRSPPMPGNGGVPRAELGSRLLSSVVGGTRPLCHPDNYSTMQHPLHLSHFSFPLATACPLASVLCRLLLLALGG